jgi:hypothetical protein
VDAVTLPPLPPWRAQDVGDTILQRGSRETPPLAWVEGLPDALIMPTSDDESVYIVGVPGQDGVQPLVWRMLVHRHAQECNRV